MFGQLIAAKTLSARAENLKIHGDNRGRASSIYWRARAVWECRVSLRTQRLCHSSCRVKQCLTSWKKVKHASAERAAPSPHLSICWAFHPQSSFPATVTWKCVLSLMCSDPLTWALITCGWQHSRSHRWDPVGPPPRRTRTSEPGLVGEWAFCTKQLTPLVGNFETVSLRSREVKFFHLFKTTFPNPKYMQIEKCQNRIKWKQIEALNLKL